MIRNPKTGDLVRHECGWTGKIISVLDRGRLPIFVARDVDQRGVWCNRKELERSQLKYGYAVVLRVERFSYDPKIGSGVRQYTEQPKTPHQNWPLRTCDTAEEADAAVAAMVHIEPPFTGHCEHMERDAD